MDVPNLYIGKTVENEGPIFHVGLKFEGLTLTVTLQTQGDPSKALRSIGLMMGELLERATPDRSTAWNSVSGQMLNEQGEPVECGQMSVMEEVIFGQALIGEFYMRKARPTQA